MSSQDSQRGSTRFEASSIDGRQEHPSGPLPQPIQRRSHSRDELGASASNTAVWITLCVGVGLLLVVVLLPYLPR